MRILRDYRKKCFNPRTPCGVRHVPVFVQIDKIGFNPRTPCGVRRGKYNSVKNPYDVSIHALLAECDIGTARGKTETWGFNPRTPCGVRHQTALNGPGIRSFNPRTPCGVRLRQAPVRPDCLQFQSTHSLRSATIRRDEEGSRAKVSIHALLAECDPSFLSPYRPECGFNPRTPCGVRLRPTLYIATQQSKSYFAPTSLKRPSLHGCSF